MNHFKLIVTEEELLYIRLALCEKNLKYTCRAIDCRNHGDFDGADFNMARHDIGLVLLNTIDSIRDARGHGERRMQNDYQYE